MWCMIMSELYKYNIFVNYIVVTKLIFDVRGSFLRFQMSEVMSSISHSRINESNKLQLYGISIMKALSSTKQFCSL